MDSPESDVLTPCSCCRMNFQTRMTCSGLKDVSDLGSVRCSSIYPELSGTGSSWQPVNFDDDMCRIDDSDEFGATMKYKSSQLTYDFNQVVSLKSLIFQVLLGLVLLCLDSVFF